ncbi:MAG: NAD(P)/FAD-dependent oxidoreductase [Alphaproteobacteria bacterium]|nr:NAD(P)/FAD-dependent oxidoreductase [Alphaproteobacteria bacterium]
MTSGLAALEAEARRQLALYDYPPRDWVLHRADADGPVPDVVIVGAGQNGIALAVALIREKIRSFVLLDQSPPGREGPWMTYARMRTLRTIKELTGPDAGLPALAFPTWFQAQFGDAAWRDLVRIPKGMWMDYLDWLRRFLALPVVNEARIVDIAPEGALVVATTRDGRRFRGRRVVLATGIDGYGEKRVPAEMAHLPRHLWAHSADDIDFAALAGRRVAVLGAGASAFDNAATALEAGAAGVGLFIRRPAIPGVNSTRWLEFAGLMRNFPELDDAHRWRFMRRIFALPVPPPQHSVERCTAHANFTLHLASPWLEARVEPGGGAGVRTPCGWQAFDFLIAATGFSVDPGQRPELARLAADGARWADRYRPPPGEEQPAIAVHPYLGRWFEFQPRRPGTDDWVERVFAYGVAALPSMGPICAGINGMPYGVQRLAHGISRSFFLEDADRYHQAFMAFDEQELKQPAAQAG